VPHFVRHLARAVGGIVHGIVDDLAVAALRPRTTDSLLLPEMVAIKHTLLAHLGLEQAAKKPAAAGAAA